MAMVTWEYEDEIYCMLPTEDGAGEDWSVFYELSQARMVPAAAGGTATAAPGATVVTVRMYAAEEEKPPGVWFAGGQELPFAVLKHFIDLVAPQVGESGEA